MQMKRVSALLLASILLLNAQAAVLAADTDITQTTQETAGEETQTITGFVSAGQQLAQVSFLSGQTEAEVAAAMPQTIQVFLGSAEQATEIAVTWVCASGDFGTTDDYDYAFIPQWDTDLYVLADGIDVLTQAPYVLASRVDDTETAAADSTADNTESAAADSSSAANSSTSETTANTTDTALEASVSLRASSSTAQTIYSFLTSEMGLNSAAACGVLANIESESDFNPNLYGDGGTSYGICQWHSGRFTALKSWCSANGYDWKTLTGQLYYLKQELSANNNAYLYNGLTILNKLKACENSAQGAYDAGYAWCYYYEVPANRASKAVTRGNKAKNTYWPTYGNTQIAAVDMKSVAYIYSDINSSDWYCAAVQYVYDNSLMVGGGNGSFEPNGLLTRAQAAQVVYNMSNSGSKWHLDSTGSKSFPDVTSDQWFAASVTWAANADVVDGYSNGCYGPNDCVTREQFAKILYGYVSKLGYDVSATTSLSAFPDAGQVSDWAQDAIQWAVAIGVMQGSDGQLRPQDSLTRAEAATMLMNLASLL